MILCMYVCVCVFVCVCRVWLPALRASVPGETTMVSANGVIDVMYTLRLKERKFSDRFQRDHGLDEG